MSLFPKKVEYPFKGILWFNQFLHHVTPNTFFSVVSWTFFPNIIRSEWELSLISCQSVVCLE